MGNGGGAEDDPAPLALRRAMDYVGRGPDGGYDGSAVRAGWAARAHENGP